ncbi:MAG: peptidoglycan-binding protein [Hyphomicrobiaceae bacterium]
MSLSPFTARMAFVAFLAIGSGIAANLLANQRRDESASEARGDGPAVAAPRSGIDVERLRRLTAETAEPGPAQPQPSRQKPPRRWSEAEKEAVIQRIGSFSPSAGRLAPVAMPGADPAEARRATIRGIQVELARRGYEPGTADGTAGLVTRAAVLAYEHDQGLPLTADPSPEVLAHLRHGTSAPGAAIGLDPDAAPVRGQAEQVIRAVQQALGRLGYLATAPDGLASDETVRAIREFEMDSGLVPTGRISGPLVARLTKEAAGRRSR